MDPKYIAVQAALIRQTAKLWGFNFPELKLPDAELVARFQKTAKEAEK